MKRPHLIHIVGIVETEHGNLMYDSFKTFYYFTDISLCGRVVSNVFWVGGFQFFQTAKKRVIFLVRNSWGVFNVVEVIVLMDRLFEGLDFLFYHHKNRRAYFLWVSGSHSLLPFAPNPRRKYFFKVPGSHNSPAVRAGPKVKYDPDYSYPQRPYYNPLHCPHASGSFAE